MGSVHHRRDIGKFLLETETLNIHARVTAIAWRKLIEEEIPEDALRRVSLREYLDDGELLEAVRAVTSAEEDFKERSSLQRGGPSDC